MKTHHLILVFLLGIGLLISVSADINKPAGIFSNNIPFFESDAFINGLSPNIQIFEDLFNGFSWDTEPKNEPESPGIFSDTLDLNRINDPDYLEQWWRSQGYIIPPSGPPYPTLPQKAYSGPCPVGKLSFKGRDLGMKYPRYREFTYKQDPRADVGLLLVGMDPKHVDAAKKICKDFNINLIMRPTSEFTPNLLKKGAVPKPEYIKSKTINRLDLLLNDKLSENDLGKVGFFKPVLPANASNDLIMRYNERMKEQNSPYISGLIQKHKELGQKTGQKIDVTESGVIELVEPDGRRRDITGDYDLFDVVDAKNGKPVLDRRLVEMIYTRLEKDLNIQHPWHAAWDYRRNPARAEIEEFDLGIIQSHMEKPLIKFGNDGSITGIIIDTYQTTKTEPDYSAWVYVHHGPLNDEIVYGPSGEKMQLPIPIDPGLKSHAICRGACGVDCDPNRCRPGNDITISIDGGTCTYRNVLICDSHQGCRDHDECFDWCEELGESSVLGYCHMVCNDRCYSFVQETMDSWTGGVGTCAAWAGLTGFEDWVYPTPFDGTILYSDPPVFQEKSGTSDPCWEECKRVGESVDPNTFEGQMALAKACANCGRAEAAFSPNRTFS